MISKEGLHRQIATEIGWSKPEPRPGPGRLDIHFDCWEWACFTAQRSGGEGRESALDATAGLQCLGSLHHSLCCAVWKAWACPKRAVGSAFDYWTRLHYLSGPLPERGLRKGVPADYFNRRGSGEQVDAALFAFQSAIQSRSSPCGGMKSLPSWRERCPLSHPGATCAELESTPLHGSLCSPGDGNQRCRRTGLSWQEGTMQAIRYNEIRTFPCFLRVGWICWSSPTANLIGNRDPLFPSRHLGGKSTTIAEIANFAFNLFAATLLGNI